MSYLYLIAPRYKIFLKVVSAYRLLYFNYHLFVSMPNTYIVICNTNILFENSPKYNL